MFIETNKKLIKQSLAFQFSKAISSFPFSTSISPINPIKQLKQSQITSLSNNQTQYRYFSMDNKTEKSTEEQNQIQNDQTPKRTGERDAFVGKWLKMKYIDFEIRGKTIQNYEMIERTTRRKDTPFDGVAVFAIIKRPNKQSSQLIVIANYRGPVDKFVLEVPAGLMDCPDVVKNAIRELKEETGYVAEDKPIKISTFDSPITYTDPWRSCSCSKQVFLEVDGSKPENINPKQDLEDAESIKVHLIDIDENISDNLTKLASNNNYIISQSLWSFAEGFSFAKKYSI